MNLKLTFGSSYNNAAKDNFFISPIFNRLLVNMAVCHELKPRFLIFILSIISLHFRLEALEVFEFAFIWKYFTILKAHFKINEYKFLRYYGKRDYDSAVNLAARFRQDRNILYLKIF